MNHTRTVSDCGRYIVIRHGNTVTVVVTKWEVSRFASTWPCSNLPDSPMRFDFASNGDLEGQWPEAERADGAAVLALCQDAQDFGDKE